jgi:hypothetical protein
MQWWHSSCSPTCAAVRMCPVLLTIAPLPAPKISLRSRSKRANCTTHCFAAATPSALCVRLGVQPASSPTVPDPLPLPTPLPAPVVTNLAPTLLCAAGTPPLPSLPPPLPPLPPLPPPLPLLPVAFVRRCVSRSRLALALEPWPSSRPFSIADRRYTGTKTWRAKGRSV